MIDGHHPKITGSNEDETVFLSDNMLDAHRCSSCSSYQTSITSKDSISHRLSYIDRASVVRATAGEWQGSIREHAELASSKLLNGQCSLHAVIPIKYNSTRWNIAIIHLFMQHIYWGYIIQLNLYNSTLPTPYFAKITNLSVLMILKLEYTEACVS